MLNGQASLEALRALSDAFREPMRARVLLALDQGPTTPNSLAEQLGVPCERVAEQLEQLVRVGLAVKDAEHGLDYASTVAPIAPCLEGLAELVHATAAPPSAGRLRMLKDTR